MKQHLIDFYLDWVNNYLSTEVMAMHYGIPHKTACALIAHGRLIHEREVARHAA